MPIVALTGHAGDPEKRQECIEAGMQEVLSKPAQPLALESVLQHFVFHMFAEKESVMKENQSTITKKPPVVIDWEGCVHMCQGDSESTHQILSVFSKELKFRQDILAKAYENKDTKALREELHRCRALSQIFHPTKNDLPLGAIKLLEHKTAHTPIGLRHFYVDL